MTITPLKVRMMLHYANAVAPFNPDPATLPMDADVSHERAELIADGLLVKSDTGSGFDVTDKGADYINRLLSVKP